MARAPGPSDGPRDAAPEPGWVESTLAEEFPGLGLAWSIVEAGRGRSAAPVKEQLRELSDRFGGAQAVNLRQRPIPHAYRVFYRHIGLDPDRTPPPPEEVSLNRMRDGRYASRNRLDDALTIAVAEVGVALTAFDADRLEGRLGLRAAAERESLKGRVTPLEPGTILIADERRPLEILFGRTAEGVGVSRSTSRTAIVAIGVKGVPDVALEEALWIASSAMLA
jgi:DNA/RNA-binding domain of Phe-tRNA-synthetase-like protein